MLRSALSALVLALGLPMAAHAFGGSLGMFDLTDHSTRGVMIGFDKTLGLNPVATVPPAPFGIRPGIRHGIDPYFGPSDPSPGTGYCNAPGVDVPTSTGIDACRSDQLIHYNLASPFAGPLPGGTGNLAAALNTGVPNTVGTKSPFQMRFNPVLAGTYTRVGDTGTIDIEKSQFRQSIDQGLFGIQTAFADAGAVAAGTQLPWQDLKVIFDFASGTDTVAGVRYYAEGTIISGLGTTSFLVKLTTTDGAMNYLDPNFNLPLGAASLPGLLQAFGGVVPGVKRGVSAADLLGTPLSFACTTDGAGAVVFDPFGVTGGVVANGATWPGTSPNGCLEIAPELVSIHLNGITLQNQEVANMTGFSFLGNLGLYNAAGDMSFYETPEPNSLLLLGAALAGLAALRRARA